MPTIRVKENEPFEVAMRRFKRAIEKPACSTERARAKLTKTDYRAQTQKAAAAKRLQKTPAQPTTAAENVLSRNAYPFLKTPHPLRCFLFYNARFPIRTRKLK